MFSPRLICSSSTRLFENVIIVKPSCCNNVASFTVVSDKRVIVGRVESGKVRIGDEILVMPSNEKVKINPKEFSLFFTEV